MGRTIAVGRENDPGTGTVDLVLTPGQEPPSPRPGLTVHAGELPDVLYTLREVFASHAAIATLGGARVLGDHPWREIVERRLIEFLEDLGNTPIDSLEGVVNAIRNGPLISAGHTSGQLAGALKGSPAIVIGAGPSASPEAMAHIARLANNHYIFACDAMTSACKAAGFVPHFVTMLERVPEMLPLVLGADPATTFIAMPVVDPKCAEQFTRHVWYWGGDDLYTWLNPNIAPANCGRSTGTLAIGAAILAGCNPIYLVGHDLAYGPDDAGHTPAAHSIAISDQIKKDGGAKDGFYEGSQHYVPGYSGSTVRTNGAWSMMRADIEWMVRNAPDQIVISAQEGRGAVIAGVRPGSLPAFGPLERVSVRPYIPPSEVVDPTTRLPTLKADIEALIRTSRGALEMLSTPGLPLDPIARDLGLGAIVSKENVFLFRYLMRTLNTSLSLRLHMRAETEHSPAKLQRECLAILAHGYIAMCHRLAGELFK